VPPSRGNDAASSAPGRMFPRGTVRRPEIKVAGMSAELQSAVTIATEQDIIRARQAGRELAQTYGFGTVDQTRLATAISELVRNVIRYAGTGECRIFTETSPTLRTIHLAVSDEGPGIPDIKLAMEPGYSACGGLGLGLPAVRRLMDRMSIESRPGHTLVTASMCRRK
jgi:serine/threonine-protein kinase RsbT